MNKQNKWLIISIINLVMQLLNLFLLSNHYPIVSLVISAGSLVVSFITIRTIDHVVVSTVPIATLAACIVIACCIAISAVGDDAGVVIFGIVAITLAALAIVAAVDNMFLKMKGGNNKMTQAYCRKCGKKTEQKNPEVKTSKRNMKYSVGNCSACNNKTAIILGKA